MSLNQAYSVVNLFYESKILPEKNFEVDSIADYLATLNKSTINDFQYIKHDRNIQIKIDLSQSNLNYVSTNDIDYVAIQNYVDSYPESIIYYFVVNKTWRSKNTILLDLYMDTINSYQGKYTLSDRTKVVREHKDRWKWNLVNDPVEQVIQYIQASDITEENGYALMTINIPSSFSKVEAWSVEIDVDYLERVKLQLINSEGKYYIRGTIGVSLEDFPLEDYPLQVKGKFTNLGQVLPIINEYSEGVSPVLFKKKEEDIEQQGLKWYLAYQNPTEQTSNHPVSVYLYPSSNISARVSSPINIYNLLSNEYDQLVIYPTMNQLQVKLNISNHIYSPYIEYIDSYMICNGYVFQRRGTSLRGYHFRTYYKNVDGKWTYDRNTTYDPHFPPASTILPNTWELSYPSTSVKVYKFNREALFTPSSFNSFVEPNTTLSLTTASQSILGIDYANRTLSTYLKIIELPYCPFSYTYDSITNTFDFDGALSSEAFDEGTSGHRLKVDVNLFKSSQNSMNVSIENPLKNLIGKPYSSFDFSTTKLRDDEYETKLYHSDYYRPKFVYDSFGYDFNLEQEDVESISIAPDSFGLIMKSSTIPSGRFLFAFPEEVKKISNLDYDSVLNISRSMDYPLLNSAYLDYIRTGYNFDMKNKTYSNISSIIGGAIGVIGGLGNMATNPLASVSGVASIGTSIANTINSIARSELSIQQKLEEKAKQANSVSGADDLDLLNYYTNGNKAKLVWYEVSDRMKQALADLFYYCGYATEEYKVPNPNTRLWFNYIQASVIIKKTDNLSDIIIQDITSRYEAGITFLHKVSGSWDIDQTKENWEVSILNA